MWWQQYGGSSVVGGQAGASCGLWAEAPASVRARAYRGLTVRPLLSPIAVPPHPQGVIVGIIMGGNALFTAGVKP